MRDLREEAGSLASAPNLRRWGEEERLRSLSLPTFIVIFIEEMCLSRREREVKQGKGFEQLILKLCLNMQG